MSKTLAYAGDTVADTDRPIEPYLTADILIDGSPATSARHQVVLSSPVDAYELFST